MSPSFERPVPPLRPRAAFAALLAGWALSGCAVIAVADATITVAATAIEAGATVAGAAVDLAGAAVGATAAGVKAATGEDEPETPPER